jgi:TolB-like protein/Tfp pilus assembly protein PilF
MGAESSTQASTPAGAVFLSYASQDAEAARKICDVLRAAGIDVWFDQSELRGGEVWDQTIRKQIKACTLFVPVISRHTHERREGYFRLEWKLAIDRSNLISATQAFLLPVVIDDTREDDEEVPEKIRDIHWTRLPEGETPPAFVERVQRLLSSEPSILTRQPAGVQSGSVGVVRAPVQGPWWVKHGILVAVGLVVWGAIAYFTFEKPRVLTPSASSPVAANAAPAAFNPPPHSIAVLPFVNMSGDKDQDYFSDGLTEELLNSLAEINELQVAARTSAFSFKDEKVDVETIARKLNVGAVLEGSVRRSGNKIRITAQLINAVTGFHLWSQTYDRDVGDVLTLESEIAQAVATALKVSLLGDARMKIDVGGTRHAGAFDAFLRGRRADLAVHSEDDVRSAISHYTEAIALDPNYALAFANRSLALSLYGGLAPEPDARESYERALTDARRAIALAPDLAEGYLALARYFEYGTLDFTRANETYERALALAPGNAQLLQLYGIFAVGMRRTELGLAAARRAVVLDPLNRASHRSLGSALYFARQHREAVAAFQDAITLDPAYAIAYAHRGLAYYALGEYDHARASCENNADASFNQVCLAVTYHKLGHHADADAQLAKLTADGGDAGAYQYAEIRAQWDDISEALKWLETALRLGDPGLEYLRTDPLMDPLRKEARFQAVMRELKFPQ